MYRRQCSRLDVAAPSAQKLFHAQGATPQEKAIYKSKADSIYRILQKAPGRWNEMVDLFSNDVTVLRTARDFGLGLVQRMPALKAFFVAEAAGLTGEVPKLLRGERV